MGARISHASNVGGFALTFRGRRHPRICALHDVGQHDGASFLVMEYLKGENLAHRLSQRPPPLDEALRHATQIADALLDFGIAKLSSTSAEGESTRWQTLTHEGRIVGTLQYMAPEQLKGGTVDEKTDVFAFGLLLYEMVGGRKAFTASERSWLDRGDLEGGAEASARRQV